MFNQIYKGLAMQELSINTELDFRLLSRKPFRGLISEIAKERGVTPTAIWFSINKMDHKDVQKIVRARMQKRLDEYNAQ